MDLRLLGDSHKTAYNQTVTHVIQSWEWGEFRKKLGLPLLRYGLFTNDQLTTAFQMTLHTIPFLSKKVGYMPKGPIPTKDLAQALEQLSTEYNCAFIKLEPNVEKDSLKPYSVYPKFQPSPKPLFTKYNFVLDLTPSQDELMKNMHSKTRYNIRLAEKRGVTVEISDTDKAFKTFLKLHFETTDRQGFHSHNNNYHTLAWETLRAAGMAKVAIAYFQKKPLSAWMLYTFKDVLYYPYGGSSVEHKEVMANNLLAWEVIKYGQSLGLKNFDMWGALGPEPDPKDPWYGFHRFKSGYGGKLVEYLGTYDLVFNDPLYWAFTSVDKFSKLKFFLLKLIGN
jgi:lipid II:glycine glycyltransferase (peptidoglycan interpeptide bridge formation enzyme)